MEEAAVFSELLKVPGSGIKNEDVSDCCSEVDDQLIEVGVS